MLTYTFHKIFDEIHQRVLERRDNVTRPADSACKQKSIYQSLVDFDRS